MARSKEERRQQKADKNHKQTFLVELLSDEHTFELLCLWKALTQPHEEHSCFVTHL